MTFSHRFTHYFVVTGTKLHYWQREASLIIIINDECDYFNDHDNDVNDVNDDDNDYEVEMNIPWQVRRTHSFLFLCGTSLRLGFFLF